MSRLEPRATFTIGRAHKDLAGLSFHGSKLLHRARSSFLLSCFIEDFDRTPNARMKCFGNPLLLLLLVCFVPLTLSFVHGVFGRPNKQNKGICVSASLQTAPRGSSDPGDDRPGNMFFEYDKPVVLLGCSSAAGDELFRLARSLQSSQIGEIVTVASYDEKKCEVSMMGTEALLTAIADQTYRWPSVIVLDFADKVFETADSQRVENLEAHLIDVAKVLYENGLLSLYVNIDPVTSNMREVAKARKTRFEDNVFVRYSDYEICLRDEGSNEEGWEHIEWELARAFARAKLIPAVPGDKTRSANTAHLTMGQHTFFLSLSFPEIQQVEPFVEEMCQDVDAMEYRADLLSCRDSRFDLLYGMQLLRRYCRPHVQRVPALPFAGAVLEDVMPIVYTVRTQNQAGTYPDDDESVARMFEMLQWGLRGGVEVLDVESAWDALKTSELLDSAESRYSSLILGSHHVVGKTISTEEAVTLFQQCALDGRSHGAKVVLSIDDESKDRLAYDASLIASELLKSEGKPEIPNISLVLGDKGSFSRVLNLPFTPVTHESLPFKAAPGQLTANEIMTTRLLTKVFKPKKYAILGHNIAYSVSPQMHGAAFAATKLPHEYIRVDVPTVEEFVESDFFKSDEFGGTSVTIPHKQAIIPFLDVLTDAAKAIGSVNTVIAREEFVDETFRRVLSGDNTDWRGIFNPLNRLLGGDVDSSSDYALILGAGGTARAAAYVASELGLQIVYYNRTPEKAIELADKFGGVVVQNLDASAKNEGSLGHLLASHSEGKVLVVISTLPASVNFELPTWLVEDESKKPIVFDVNYKPYNTRLLLQAEEAGCSVVRGSEMLWEQGIGQFELWTGRTAPYRIMKEVVLQNCGGKQVENDDCATVVKSDAIIPEVLE